MKKRILLTVLVMAAVAQGLVGCAQLSDGYKSRFNLADPSLSIVYGYLDLSALPVSVDIDNVAMEGLDGEEPYLGNFIENGVFWNPWMKPGYRRISSFGGSARGFLEQGWYRFRMGPQGKGDVGLEIKTPGVHFIGAYKYVDEEGGKFSLQKIPLPAGWTEKKLLQAVLEDLPDHYGNKAPRHTAMLKQKIAELR